MLRLVAGGCTNREVGARLQISEKTVSVHLFNVFAKLGVADRRAAAELARDVGLVTGVTVD